MKIKYSKRARKFLVDQIEYLESVNIHASQRVYERISDTVNRLKDNPYLGKQHPFDDFREIIEAKYKFKILYYVDKEMGIIFILAIFNTRMDSENIYKSIYETN